MQDLISIVVPIYNMEKYLVKCLDSIVGQTYENLEIILVNDGSKDSSLTICREYAQRDKRIVVLDKENGGQGSARNTGMDVATGEWIGFIDSDDWIVPDMYEVLLGHCLRHNADIGVCDVFTETPVEKNEVIKVMDYSEFYPELIYDSISSHPCNKLFRRSLYEQNSHGRIRFSDRNSVDDMMIMPEIFDDAHKIVITNRTLYCYFNAREDSVSNSSHTVHLNSYERSIAFQKRYKIAKERGYETEQIFSKAISFGIGAFGRMENFKGKYQNEMAAFRQYVHAHRKQIKENSHLSRGRKVACFIIDNMPGLYGFLFRCALKSGRKQK